MRLWSAAGAALLLVLLTGVIAIRHGRPLPLDDALHGWAVHHRPHATRDVAIVITSTGVGVVPYVLAGTAGVIAGSGPRGRALMAALAIVLLLAVQALRFGVVTSLGRARPPMSDWAVHVSGSAFPSGHTVTSAMAAALLIWAARRHLHRTWWRWAVVLCVAVWAIAVGLTRVYLGVHWPTDVAGGWLFTATAIGLAAWLASAVTARRGGAGGWDGDARVEECSSTDQ
jgi:membrane-associated phospholipid phosphatase